MDTFTLNNFTDRPPLTHLKRLTTKDGLIQHADQEVPDPSFGYSIDDNARALIVCLWHYHLFHDPSLLQLAEIYFNYLKKAEKEEGSFHNFLSFTEKILDAEGSEDSIARAVWALGETVSLHPDEAVKKEAQAILDRTNIERHRKHNFVRTKAYILLGLLSSDRLEEARFWADELVKAYNEHQASGWQWFEDSLRYANGILPYALARAYQKLPVSDYLEIAKKTYVWLDKESRIHDLPAPIGQNGWYYKGQAKAQYDQQPLEAADMVLAAVTIYESSKEDIFLSSALEWMSWYHGYNVQQASIFNEKTGGIYDGVTATGVNTNQGAESIVTYLLAYLSLAKLKHG